MIRIVCCLSLLMGLLACVSDLPGLLPQPPAKLVLWSEIRAGEPFEAYLGRTFPIEGPEPDSLWLAEGSVEVWQGDSLLAQLVHQAEGRYLGPPQVLAQEGVSYRLEARFDTLPTVRAVAPPVPTSPVLRFFDWQDSVFSSNPFNPQLSAGQLSFAVDTTEAYGFGLRTLGYLEGEPEPEQAWFLDRDPFSDEGPNPCAKFGQTGLNLSLIACPIWRMGVISAGIGGGLVRSFDSLVFVIFPLSEAAYTHFSQEQPIGLDRAFWEPEPLISNVEGGYGLVWTTHPLRRRVRLGQ